MSYSKEDWKNYWLGMAGLVGIIGGLMGLVGLVAVIDTYIPGFNPFPFIIVIGLLALMPRLYVSERRWKRENAEERKLREKEREERDRKHKERMAKHDEDHEKWMNKMDELRTA